jgi:dienelactone hydrolase
MIYGEEDFPFIIETCNALRAAYEAAHLEIKVIAIPDTGHEFRGADGYGRNRACGPAKKWRPG